MAVRIVIHVKDDVIYTIAANGVVRAFVVTSNGMVESTDMTTAIEKEVQVDLGAAE